MATRTLPHSLELIRLISMVADLPPADQMLLAVLLKHARERREKRA